MIQPHGGKLVDRTVSEAQKPALLARAAGLPCLELDREQAKLTQNLAHGVYSPLEGFMDRTTLEAVLKDSHLPAGAAWTIPLLLNISAGQAREWESVSQIALNFAGKPLALLDISDIYHYDPLAIAAAVYGVTDEKHPGVANTLSRSAYFLGGKISLLSDTDTPFAGRRFYPAQTREIFAARGWEKIVAFQTRNAPHLGHEYLQKTALTLCDGLFINPVIGKKKSGDFTDQVIIDSYQVLLENYFRQENVLLGILEYEMAYAGPKEAIHHAIMRKNFGCSHIIIGRDHAGVGNYYSPYAAQEIFADFPELGIEPMIFNSFYYCRCCGAVVNDKICPHDETQHINYSGTKVRAILSAGEADQDGLLRPEVVAAIQQVAEPLVK